MMTASRTLLFFTRSISVGLLVLATAHAGAQDQSAANSDFQQMGGKPGIRKNVDDFLTIVLADPRIKEDFKDADIDRLAGLLTDQFCVLTGGPCKYEGKDMKEAHEKMNLVNANFNALAEDLQEALVRNGVPYGAQYRLLGKLAPMQKDIVTK